jgi:hypothetical protein
MKGGARVALAVAAGYYLGRRHKLRTAVGLAIVGAVRGLTSGKGGAGLLQQGAKVLGSSPELEKITDRIRGDLMEVGKAAAVAATSKQIDSLSGKLHERAEALRTPGAPSRTRATEPEADGGRAREPEDEYEEEPYEEEQPARTSEARQGGPEQRVARPRG